MIPERHPGCLSFLENLNKCDEINGKVEEPNQDYNGSDQNKQIEESIKKESSKLNVLLLNFIGFQPFHQIVLPKFLFIPTKLRDDQIG